MRRGASSGRYMFIARPAVGAEVFALIKSGGAHGPGVSVKGCCCWTSRLVTSTTTTAPPTHRHTHSIPPPTSAYPPAGTPGEPHFIHSFIHTPTRRRTTPLLESPVYFSARQIPSITRKFPHHRLASGSLIAPHTTTPTTATTARK